MAGIDKGTIVKQLISRSSYDIVVAVGDDKTDEDMFAALNENSYSIKIGTGHTLANYYLPNQHNVLDVLKRLAAADPDNLRSERNLSSHHVI